ncbi:MULTISPECIES: CinA family protein [Campylobacter]|uniref:CinA family protein n=1 Tax=Campylobacter TaxID=194 RepID=UPI000A35839F|nr:MULTISPECIES: CinA family protein [unclassified Campylobacter]MEE3693968.1 CinA family protein [Campylobacter sp. CLAX-22107-21]
MKNLIIILGEDLQINRPFLDYFFTSYKEKFGALASVYYIQNNDKELPFYIENFTKEYDNITICANENGFNTLSKILATLTTDTIELKFETLMPSQVIKFSKNSFLISLNNSQINLIKAEPIKELPEILTQDDQQSKIFHIIDIDKESAQILLEPLTASYNVNITLTTIIDGLTKVKVSTSRYGHIDSFIDSVANLFIGKIIPADDIIEFTAKKLIQNDKKITFAESCTAGMCAAALGNIPGVSVAFSGSLVTYSNEIKNSWIGVDKDILDSFGAVSAQCAEAMASGALGLGVADYAIAISGIAGPDGGSTQKPVGTVFIAVASANNVASLRLLLSGDRNYIRTQSVLHAFTLLLRQYPELCK